MYLIPFFRDAPLDKINDQDLERYKNERLGQGVCESTVNRELAVLSHFFTKAVEWKWLNHRPVAIKKFKENEPRITYLTKDWTLCYLRERQSRNNLVN